MGLDMYLSRKVYLFGHGNDSPRKKISINLDGIVSDEVSELTQEIGYWRKSNQIHNWFVDRVQKGIDDCGEYEVSEEQLKELLGKVDKVLVNHNSAPDILPTQEGFFFGSIEYDSYYFSDLEDTKEILEKALSIKDPEGCFSTLVYHSSW